MFTQCFLDQAKHHVFKLEHIVVPKFRSPAVALLAAVGDIFFS